MKKLMRILLLFTLVIAFASVGKTTSVTASTKADIVERGKCGEHVTWSLDSNGTLRISGTGPMNDYTAEDKKPWMMGGSYKIKKVIIGKGITYIGENSFYYCTNVEEVELSNTVKEIGEAAFSNCEKISKVELPNSLVRLNNNVFAYCDNLSSISIPDSVQYIGSDVFECTEWMKNMDEEFVVINGILLYYNGYSDKVIIPDSVSTIGFGAFYGCDMIEVIIPDSVTQIMNKAFEYCEVLSSVSLPNSLKVIEDYAFNECKSLSRIILPNKLEKIGRGSFLGCKRLSEIIIPDSVKEIGRYAFDNTSWLNDNQEEFMIENGFLMKYNGNEQNVVIPQSVTDICDDVFYRTENMKSVTIPDSVTYIGAGAFQSCSKLKSIHLSKSLTKINSDTFKDCESLEEIVIPESIQEIGSSAFSGCKKIKSVTIPDSVIAIDDYAFSSCSNLAQIIIPDTVEYIGGNILSGTKWFNEQKGLVVLNHKLIKYSGADEKIIIPSSVKAIDDGVFKNCKTITSVIFPKSLIEIGDHIFDGCSSLKSVTIPSSVQSIGAYAFAECKSLTDMTILNPDVEIDVDAFVFSSQVTLCAEDNSHIEFFAKYEVFPFKPLVNLTSPVISSTNQGKGYIAISWGKVKNATHYRVYRRIGNGKLEYIGSTKSTRFYDKKGLVKGKTYKYYIRAFRYSRSGKFSNSRSVIYSNIA